MRVAVIGGGPSGLTTLKYLTSAHEFFDDVKPIEAKLFESEASVGGTFKHRAYENAEVSCIHRGLVSADQGLLVKAHRDQAPDYHQASIVLCCA
jgi:protoporphyrinogen oxidase